MNGNDTLSVRSWCARIRRSVPFDRRDARWLPLAMLPAIVAVLVYWATNPFPAYGAGLYTKIATEIAAGGYLPPERIPGYTVDGVPFAYPPLQFYVLAVLLDLGIDPFVLSRFVPGIVVVLAQVPIYLLARDVSGSRPAGAVAGAVVASSQPAIQWHVSAGGLVRAFALLYALTAIYAGHHVFRDSGRVPIVVGVVAFGLSVLTHPTYSLFVVVTYVLMWGVTDRSVDGFGRGAIVGFGGLLIAAPWLIWVHVTHGITTLTAAAGTHGGIGGGLVAVVERPTDAYFMFGVVAALLYKRYRFLPAWIGSVSFVFAQPRFARVATAVGVSALLSSWIEGRPRSDRESPALGPSVVTVALVLAAAGGGAHYAHTMTQDNDVMTPSFVDEEDVAAMEWVATETAGDATFLVLGDVAEEFPAHTDRVIVVGPWGVEWVAPAAYYGHLEGFETVSNCNSVDCVETVAQSVGEPPDYVYVPRGKYSVRGKNAVQFGTLERSFEHSGEYERVMENDGVVIYRSLDS